LQDLALAVSLQQLSFFLKVVWIVQEAEEGHSDNGKTISKTGLARTLRNAQPQQEIGRAEENWCVVLWSPTFSNEDGK